MNPIASRLNLVEPLRFLLIGKIVYYRDGREPERIWSLNIYTSPKSRSIAAKKMRREYSDIIFIEWDVTMEQIVKQGKFVNILQPENILLSDKEDILKQLKQK